MLLKQKSLKVIKLLHDSIYAIDKTVLIFCSPKNKKKVFV